MRINFLLPPPSLQQYLLGFSPGDTRNEVIGQYRVVDDCEIIKKFAHYHYHDAEITGRNTEGSLMTIVNMSVNGPDRTDVIFKVAER